MKITVRSNFIVAHEEEVEEVTFIVNKFRTHTPSQGTEQTTCSKCFIN